MTAIASFARKLWPGWMRASIILYAMESEIEVGLWIVQFAFPQ